MHPEIGLADIRKTKPPQFEIGDTVDVHVKIQEGDKERIQVFTGTVIARRGEGLGASFTVRRVVQGHGVERIFPLHAPTVSAVKVKRHGKTRRAKLYFLRDRVGKKVRLRERLAKKGLLVEGEADSIDAEEATIDAEATTVNPPAEGGEGSPQSAPDGVTEPQGEAPAEANADAAGAKASE